MYVSGVDGPGTAAGGCINCQRSKTTSRMWHFSEDMAAALGPAFVKLAALASQEDLIVALDARITYQVQAEGKVRRPDVPACTVTSALVSPMHAPHL